MAHVISKYTFSLELFLVFLSEFLIPVIHIMQSVNFTHNMDKLCLFRILSAWTVERRYDGIFLILHRGTRKQRIDDRCFLRFVLFSLELGTFRLSCSNQLIYFPLLVIDQFAVLIHFQADTLSFLIQYFCSGEEAVYPCPEAFCKLLNSLINLFRRDQGKQLFECFSARNIRMIFSFRRKSAGIDTMISVTVIFHRRNIAVPIMQHIFNTDDQIIFIAAIPDIYLKQIIKKTVISRQQFV